MEIGSRHRGGAAVVTGVDENAVLVGAVVADLDAATSPVGPAERGCVIAEGKKNKRKKKEKDLVIAFKYKGVMRGGEGEGLGTGNKLNSVDWMKQLDKKDARAK